MTLPQMFTEPRFWVIFSVAFLLLIFAAGFGRGFVRGLKRARERRAFEKEAEKKLGALAEKFREVNPHKVREQIEKAGLEAAREDEKNYIINVATGFAIHRGCIAPEAFNKAEEILSEAKRRGYFKPPRSPLSFHIDPPPGAQSEQS